MKKLLYSKAYGDKQTREIPQRYKDIILSWLTPTASDTILEIGAGKGQLLDFLKTHTSKAMGLEINEDQVKEAKRKELLLGDATAIPLKNTSIHKSLSLHTLEHIPDLHKVFEELDRVTKKNGLTLHAFPSSYISKAEGAWSQAWHITHDPIKAWKLANQLHVHELNPKNIGQFLTHTSWKLIRHKRIFVPQELGFSWIILLQKG